MRCAEFVHKDNTVDIRYANYVRRSSENTDPQSVKDMPHIHLTINNQLTNVPVPFKVGWNSGSKAHHRGLERYIFIYYDYGW